MALFASRPSAAAFADRLAQPELVLAPGCYDALGAALLEQAGHEALFLGGFSVAATQLSLPDTGLLSYGEMLDQLRPVTAATSLPVIADADTGYGNAVNAQRALQGYAQAGATCVMIEDQTWPKQCGHTTGKQVVDRSEAVARVQAAVEIRDELGLDVLLMARTDAASAAGGGATGFDEAIERAKAFADVGADITFLEAPESLEQMARYCADVPGPKTANMVEDGRTPWCDPATLTDLGYSLALYPVSMLLATIDAATKTAAVLRRGEPPTDRVSFDDARMAVGWSDYDTRTDRYASDSTP